jgi:peptide/nickel transport system substrate-binding protein
VGFKRAAGTEGTKARRRPRDHGPEADGRRQDLHLHAPQGNQVLNGKTLKASDVKYTFERLFKIGQSPNAGTWYNVIVGGDACVKDAEELQSRPGRYRR